MADWFSEMIESVSDDVVASPETAARLELTDRVTRKDLKDAAVRSEDELRTQFAYSVKAIQEIRDSIHRLQQEALPLEWNAVAAARQRLWRFSDPRFRRVSYEGRRASDPRNPRVSNKRRGLRRWLGMSIDKNEESGSSDQKVLRAKARQAYDDAVSHYQQAIADRQVDDLQPIRSLWTEIDQRQSMLRDLLNSALMLKVNEVVDAVLDASYERDFSYAEPPVLTDPLGVSVQPVNTAAHRKIKYLIEKVGSGTIGVAGPRGSGKSTLLSQFAITVKMGDQPAQWGVCVPAPTRYDPRDFLLYLFAQLCVEVLGPTQARQVESHLTSHNAPAERGLRLSGIVAFAGIVALACCAVVIGLRSAHLGEPPRRMTDLTVASCLATVFLLSAPPAYALLGSLNRPRTLRRSRRGRGRSRRPVSPQRNFLIRLTLLLNVALALAGLTAAALFALLVAGYAPDPGYLAAGALAVASAVSLVAWASAKRFWTPRPDSLYSPRDPEPESWYRSAEDWYAKVKFQQSFTAGWSGALTVGSSSLPAQLQTGTNRSAEVTRLAMSTPEIVGAIKSFAQILSRQVSAYPSEHRVPVIIGVDELDKIEDPREAQAFLNQIKGLFGDSSCLFLISISDDAMAAFERRGMPFRDTFDSSLSSVVTLSYLSRREARTLTGSRLVGVQEPVADLLFVLAGGLPRDLVRLIRQAVEAREQGRNRLESLAQDLIAAEIGAKKKAVLARARAVEPCPARDHLLSWAARSYDPARVYDVGRYFAVLLGQAVSLLDKDCDGTAHQPAGLDTDGCLAREMGAYGYWLATVGQIFMACSTREHFTEAETVGSDRSFERLAEARQSFSLGPDYVLATLKEIRMAWALPDG